MAEERSFGSQESLPLSDGTFYQLLNQLEIPMNSFVNDVAAMDIPTAQEFPTMINDGSTDLFSALSTSFVQEQARALCNIQIPSAIQQQFNLHPASVEPVHAPAQHAPSSLPASENWPGPYSFNVSFNSQENAKGVTWIYSKLKSKLFVGKDVPCPVNFSTFCYMTGDVHIRATALFASADDAAEIVHRCPNHAIEEISKGVPEAEHLIRCESSSARYEKDPRTGRHSVVVPFENPPAGQSFSTYIFKFLCFGSCAGGPNRRPLLLVFTLEKGTEVVGRMKVDLKICACPGRDMRTEEKLMSPNQPNVNENKRKEPPTPTFDISSIKKMKPATKKEGPFTIKMYDRKCYEFLKRMKRFYQMYSIMKDHFPSDWKCLFYPSQSSDEDVKSDN